MLAAQMMETALWATHITERILCLTNLEIWGYPVCSQNFKRRNQSINQSIISFVSGNEAHRKKEIKKHTKTQ